MIVASSRNINIRQTEIMGKKSELKIWFIFKFNSYTECKFF